MSKSIEIVYDLQKRIIDGVYPVKLPPMRALAKEYGVNLKTISKCVGYLCSSGVVEARKSSGVYISNINEGNNVRPNGRNVALLVRHYGDYFAPLFNTMVREIDSAGAIPLLLPHRKEGAGRERLDELLEHKPLAIIIDAMIYGFDSEYLAKCASRVPRLIFLMKRLPPPLAGLPTAYWVTSDFYYGAYLAVKHLAELGHSSILLLREEPSGLQALEFRHTVRFNYYIGYLMAMKEFGLKAEVVEASSFSDSSWGNEIIRRLQADDRPTAILCSQDDYAVEVMDIASELHLRVPLDLSVVGCYDLEIGRKASVPLTSIRVNEERIGALAAELALTSVPGSLRQVVLPDLVVRNSTSAPRILLSN